MQLAPRDLALLQFLDRTPATVSQILKVSAAFEGGPFRDERRVRERLQALSRGSLVRSYSLGVTGGGLANYYKLTPEAYRMLHGAESSLPHRSFFAELSPSRLLHTLSLADLIVHSYTAAHAWKLPITGFHRENELVLETGAHRVSPDCHVQIQTAGKTYNVLFELDRNTEPLDSSATSSIRRKILAYEAYQDYVWGIWKRGGGREQRPYFRVAFVTSTADRAEHILGLAQECARNRDRRLCYATTIDQFLAEPDALRFPLFLDHHGYWQALINIHPSARFIRTPVRIAPRVQPMLPLD